MKIYLDAGHGRNIYGNYDSGAVDNKSNDKYNTIEATVNVDMVNRIAHHLRELSPSIIVYTGHIDPNLQKDLGAKATDEDDLKEAVAAANKAKVDLYVSLHCNSSPNGTAAGFEVHYHGSKSKLVASTISAKFADISAKYHVKNRGIVNNPSLYVLKKTTMPSILIEIGFISNSKEEATLNNAHYREDLALVIASALIKDKSL